MRSFWLYTLKWTFGGLFLIFITFKASTGNFLLELLGRWTIACMGVLCWDGPKRLYSEKICGRNVIMRFCLQNIHLITLLQIVSQIFLFIFEIRKPTSGSFLFLKSREWETSNRPVFFLIKKIAAQKMICKNKILIPVHLPPWDFRLQHLFCPHTTTTLRRGGFPVCFNQIKEPLKLEFFSGASLHLP